MGSFWQRRSVRICRVVIRWMRITFLALALGVVSFVAYLHWVGLPGWIKGAVLGHLRDLGYEVEFTRMRLGWGPAVIVEEATFQRMTEGPEPRLSAARADLELTPLDLARARVAVKGLEVRDATLRFPPAGQENHSLSLDNIQFDLLFPPTNTVRLTNATATFCGVRLSVHGELEHAEAVRQWKPLRPGRAKTSWQALLDRTTDTLDKIHFSQSPVVELRFGGDARDLDKVKAHLSVKAPDVSTPWGEGRKIRLEADLQRPLSTNTTVLEATFGADEVATPWAQGVNIQLTENFDRDADFDVDADTHFTARQLKAVWGTNVARSSDLRWDGSAHLDGTNFKLLRASGQLRMAQAVSSRGQARDLALRLDGSVREDAPVAQKEWGFWGKLAPYRLRWQLSGSDITALKLNLDSVALAGDWSAPEVHLTQLQAKLYEGGLNGKASLEIGTRELAATVEASFDERRVAAFLTPAARHWLSQFSWKTPPVVRARARAVAPEWTARPPEWAAEMRRSLEAAGDFAARDGTFRGAPVEKASGHFGYTNRVWTVPDLRVTAAGGELGMTYSGSDETHLFQFSIDSTVPPEAARELLPEAKRRWLSEVSFTAPPKLHLQAWGKWKAPETVGLQGWIWATNFTAHGEKLDSLEGAFAYTNHFLTLSNARAVEGSQYAAVGLAEADLETKRVLLSNVLGAVSSDLIARLCAPRRPKWLNILQFKEPASVQMGGVLQVGDADETDLNFQAIGEHVHITNAVVERVAAGVRWQGRHVAVTNIQARVYATGTVVGSMLFDIDTNRGTDLSCTLTAKDVDLHRLAAGLLGHTNKLEGMLDGDLTMDRCNLRDHRQWSGLGSVRVHNALLWDIKIFGVFSPILNAIVPGSGNSRAYEASANYVITNGVLATDDLKIRSTGFRLLYRGDIDLVSKQINAKAEAELLRNTRFFGAALSVLLSPLSKLFEYKIIGQLHSPRVEPVFIPQPLMTLLRPFHTLKTLGNGSGGENGRGDNPVNKAVPDEGPNKK